MLDPLVFAKISRGVSARPSMVEDEMTLCFDQAGFFRELGYSRLGIDLRSQKPTDDKAGRPDRFCLDDLGNTIFVFEAKAPEDEDLARVRNPRNSKWFGQLWDRYVIPMRARFGILTNGIRFVLFERVGTNPLLRLDIPDISAVRTEEAGAISALLSKPPRKFETIREVDEYVRSDLYGGLKIDEALDQFYAAYELSPVSQFGQLLSAVYSLFNERYRPGARNFTTVAFDFWHKSYAASPKRVPDSWQAFPECTEPTLLQFMFCLETTHVVLARLILAKVCEDYAIPTVGGIRSLQREVRNVDGRVPTISYPIFLSGLLERMRDGLIESIFEEDIYSWWTDEIRELRTKTDRELAAFRPKGSLAGFSSKLRQVLFSVARFDFSSAREDVLGNLYQRYFDKESRKALGEFYTRNEVVDFILDQVAYKKGLANRRLIDPCCGSGTFVVEATRRYLKDADERLPSSSLKWGGILRDICLRPRIVALDIHPFAAIVTQVRLMIEIIPYFRKALSEDADFSVHRLPVFRTDSLEQEARSAARTLWASTAKGVELSIELPIRLATGKFHRVTLLIPDRLVVQRESALKDASQYFAAVQALFDTVKLLARQERFKLDRQLLATNLARYLPNVDPTLVIDLFAPSAEGILETIRSLKYEFGDGRLVKSIEDVALASILKNSFQYDFVVANPPYIRAFRGDADARDHYRDLYNTPSGAFDTYAVFIERCISWLGEGGRTGLITSNKYLVTDYAKELRPYIFNNCEIESITDLTGCPSAFEEPVVAAAILVATRRPGDLDLAKEYGVGPSTQTTVCIVKEDDIALLSKGSRLIRTCTAAEGETLEVYSVPQTYFKNGAQGGWEIHLTPPLRRIIDSLEERAVRMNDPKLGSIRGGVRGTEYAAAEEHVSEGPPKSGGESVKLLNVGSIGPFYSRWGKSVRYHFKDYNRPYIAYSEDFFTKELWKAFRSPKIVIRGVSHQLTAYYDDEGVGFLRAIWSLLPAKETDPQFIVGLLNSALYDFMHKVRMRSARIPEGSYNYSLGFVESLPIRLPQSAHERRLAGEISAQASTLGNLAKLRHRMSMFPDAYLPSDVEVEQEVFSPDESARKAGFELAMSLTDYLVVTSRGRVVHTTAQEVSAVNRSYLLAALKEVEPRQGAQVRIQLPRSEAVRRRMVDALVTDRRLMAKLAGSASREALDEHVFDYYGVGLSDRKRIRRVIKEMALSDDDSREPSAP